MSGILLGTHGGPGADGATRVASLLARRLGVSLTTVVVLAPMPVADYGFGVVYVPTPEDDKVLRETLLGCVRAQLDRCGVEGDTPQIRVGQVAPEIAATAAALEADLIV